MSLDNTPQSSASDTVATKGDGLPVTKISVYSGLPEVERNLGHFPAIAVRVGPNIKGFVVSGETEGSLEISSDFDKVEAFAIEMENMARPTEDNPEGHAISAIFDGIITAAKEDGLQNDDLNERICIVLVAKQIRIVHMEQDSIWEHPGQK